MTIKQLLEDYGTTQMHIRKAFNVSKQLVNCWYNKGISKSKYNMIKGYLVANARLFLNKHDK